MALINSILNKKQKYSKNVYGTAWGLPPQMISTAEKETDEWKEGCMDFFDYQATRQDQERWDDYRKLRIVSGDYNLQDFKYVNEPLAVRDIQKAGTENQEDYYEDMVHYPIMVRPLNTIIGEYIKRIPQLHGFYARNESNYARNQYNQTKTDMLRQYCIQQIMVKVQAKVTQSGIKPGTTQFDQAVQQQTPEDIQDFMDRQFVDAPEQVYQTLLKNIWKKESLDSEFVEGFKSACTLAKTFYHTYKVNHRTKIRNLSSLDVFCHKSQSTKWVGDGQYAGFRWYLTPSAVIDMFYDKLTVDDMKEIEAMVNPNVSKKTSGKKQKSGSAGIEYDTETFANAWGDFNEYRMRQTFDMIDSYQRFGSGSSFANNYGLIKVVRAYWKSSIGIGWLTSYNENDEEIIEMVDDSYTADKSKGEHIDWTPCNQIYTGAKIGNSIYLDIGPYQDQIIDFDDLGDQRLPIDGCLYNDATSKPFSLVDLMTPWNELYDIVAYELKEDMNSSLGKVLFMSVDHIPNIPGFDMDKWYYWAKKFKIAWVKQPKGAPNTFNQFSSADMSFAQQMITKMQTLQDIQMNCDAIAGFSPNRVAASSSTSNTLGEASQQLVASVNQTEYLFFRHSKLVERVLNQAVNLARKDLKNDTFMRNLFDDFQLAYIDYDPDEATAAKVAIYITNSGEDQQKRQMLQGLMQPAVQNGADFADISEMLLADTISEVKTIANRLRRNAKNILVSKQQYEQQEIQYKHDIEQRKLDDVVMLAREKNESNERQAYIKTFGGRNASPEDDADGDGTPDVLEFAEFSLKQQDLFSKHALNQSKFEFERKKHFDNMTIEERKLAISKRKIQEESQRTDAELKIKRMQVNKRPSSKS